MLPVYQMALSTDAIFCSNQTKDGDKEFKTSLVLRLQTEFWQTALKYSQSKIFQIIQRFGQIMITILT